MSLPTRLGYLHRCPLMPPDAGEGRHTAERVKTGHGPVTVDPGQHVGRHRLPYGCDPEGWSDGLVFWSKTHARWVRVTGYTDEPLS